MFRDQKQREQSRHLNTKVVKSNKLKLALFVSFFCMKVFQEEKVKSRQRDEFVLIHYSLEISVILKVKNIQYIYLLCYI